MLVICLLDVRTLTRNLTLLHYQQLLNIWASLRSAREKIQHTVLTEIVTYAMKLRMLSCVMCKKISIYYFRSEDFLIFLHEMFRCVVTAPYLLVTQCVY
jgi:hypothetical protein